MLYTISSTDRRVSACATITLWTAFHALQKEFEICSISPVEITEKSTPIPTNDRIFPQSGLTLDQIITCIRSMNLEAEVLTLKHLLDDQLITTAIKAYTNLDIPLIAIFEIENRHQYHAAVITGYQFDNNGKIKELYVHDDQIGPYNKVDQLDDFRIWDNEWCPATLDYLVIPVYHKIRQSFLGIYDERLLLFDIINDEKKNSGDQINTEDIDAEIFLSTVQ